MLGIDNFGKYVFNEDNKIVGKYTNFKQTFINIAIYAKLKSMIFGK